MKDQKGDNGPLADGGMTRLIEYTGERCVPWSPDLGVIYEHLHRYRFAAQLAAGRSVVDLASGEGYGAALLAETAREVVGIEIDGLAVEHSRRTYRRPNLTFIEASMLDAKALPKRRFEVVTCFEAIEHVDDHKRLIANIRGLLAEHGLVLISTPDRRAYDPFMDEVSSAQNPFHVHELDRHELLGLLEGFEHVTIFDQAQLGGSLILDLSHALPQPVEIIPVDGDRPDWATIAFEPIYLLAIASDRPLPALPPVSILADRPGRVEREAARLRTQAADQEAEVAELRAQVSLLGASLASSRAEVERAHLDLQAMMATKGWRALKALRRIRNGALRWGRWNGAERPGG